MISLFLTFYTCEIFQVPIPRHSSLYFVENLTKFSLNTAYLHHFSGGHSHSNERQLTKPLVVERVIYITALKKKWLMEMS